MATLVADWSLLGVAIIVWGRHTFRIGVFWPVMGKCSLYFWMCLAYCREGVGFAEVQTSPGLLNPWANALSKKDPGGVSEPWVTLGIRSTTSQVQKSQKWWVFSQ